MAARARVVLLGPDIDHRRSLESMLRDCAHVSWVPDSASRTGTQGHPLMRRIRRALDQATRTRDAGFLSTVSQRLDESGATVLLGYWGTGPLSDMAAIRRLRPHVRLVLLVLCYPLALDTAGVARQRWMMRQAASHLDGIVYPSAAMAAYFEHRVFDRARPKHSLVLPPCWPAHLQSPGRAPTGPDRPNLIFVGRTDLSGATVHRADDVRPLMRDLLDAGIEVHHARSPETSDGHPFRRPFEPYGRDGLGPLIERMSAHDASLVAYNTAACRRRDRFDVTVPDRLITSVAAGVPVAIPADGYDGCRQYLANYGGVFVFGSPEDLRRQLSDRPRVHALRAQAWESRSAFQAESHGPALGGFLENLS